jgi:hypothetical protein
METNTLTLDNAIAHFMRHQTADGIAQMVAGGASLWSQLSASERFQAGFIKHEVGEVLRSVNAFIVLGSVQRVRPDIAQVVGTPAGLTWLDSQLQDLRGRFSG